MAAGGAASLLTSIDSLFTTQAQRDEVPLETVVQLPTEQISDFLNHPFKVLMDDKMAELVDSVRQYGILVPAIVRPAPDGGYQMVAGHRRKRASLCHSRRCIHQGQRAQGSFQVRAYSDIPAVHRGDPSSLLQGR